MNRDGAQFPATHSLVGTGKILLPPYTTSRYTTSLIPLLPTPPSRLLAHTPHHPHSPLQNPPTPHNPLPLPLCYPLPPRNLIPTPLFAPTTVPHPPTPLPQAASALPAARLFLSLLHDTLFVTQQLTDYVCLEVFDTRWHLFEAKVARAASVDDLCEEHERLVSCLRGCL